MDSTPEMILRMFAATLLYIGVTALVCLFLRGRKMTPALRVGVGLLYGLCAVVSNHLGIEYMGSILNVRDIAPLAAGLFFDPLSGILAGLIGGVERFILGEIWAVGWLTRWACGVSTCLAGFLAAALRRWVYHGKRPSAVHAFMVGAVMEVFHMYAILVTNADTIYLAYTLLQSCAIPMIVFTALGMAGCSFAVLRLSGESADLRLFLSRAETPIFVHFQRQLLILTVVLFSFSVFSEQTTQLRYARENAGFMLQFRCTELEDLWKDSGGDTEQLLVRIRDLNALSDNTVYLVDLKEKRMLTGMVPPEEARVLSPADLELLRQHADGSLEPFSATLDATMGMESYSVVHLLSDRWMILVSAYTVLMDEYSQVQLYDTLLSGILIFAFFYLLVSLLVENLVVRKLRSVNDSLGRIISGNLHEKVEVRDSLEFTQLSEDINRTVDTLRGYIGEAEKRMESDLKLAAEIQDSALPKVFRFGRTDFEIHALMNPAREVGGDFYDFFFIDRDVLALVIADVSGKSVPAAMFMMRSKTAIKNYARSGSSPAEILSRVNDTLCEGNDAEMFVTVWLGILDLRTGKMRCANAGHEYPVRMPAGGEYALIRDRHSLALAAMEGAPMREYELDLAPGDRIYVYTDGVPEAINEASEAYGTERLVATLNRLRTRSQQEILEGVLADVRAFAGAAEQFDDITMLGLTWLGPEAKE